MDTIFNLIWYKKILHDDGQEFSFNKAVDDNSLFFTINSKGNVMFYGINLFSGDYYKSFTGVIDKNGSLIEFDTIPGDDCILTSRNDIDWMHGNRILTDNCNSMFVVGGFCGNMYFRNDAISSTTYGITDGFVLHQTRNKNLSIINTDQTEISLDENITLSLTEENDSILWSTGSTSDNITLYGIDLGIGHHKIWVDILKNNCWYSDTVEIKVFDNFGIEDNKTVHFSISPNPVENYLNLFVQQGSKIHHVKIYDLKGSLLLESKNDIKTLDVSALEPGLYLLEVENNKSKVRMKLIKK